MLSRKWRIRIRYLSGFFKLIRLNNLLIIIFTQYLVRIFLTGPKESWKTIIADPYLFLLSLSTLIMASAGYMINDYYDVKIDTINKPRDVVVGRLFRRRRVLIFNIALNLLGILLGFYLSISVGIINILAGFFLWLYSNQLKRLPFVGNFTIAALTALSLLIVLAYFPEKHLRVFTFAIFAFFISLIREIIKDIEDMKGDATFGCKTLPILWGIRRTKNLIYFLIIDLFVLLAAFGYYLKVFWNVQFLIIYGTVFVIIPLLFFNYKLYGADTKKDFKYLSSLCKMIMLGGVTTIMLM